MLTHDPPLIIEHLSFMFHLAPQELDTRDDSPLPSVYKNVARSPSPVYKEDMKILREESDRAARIREELERTARVEKELQRARTKRCQN